VSASTITGALDTRQTLRAASAISLCVRKPKSGSPSRTALTEYPEMKTMSKPTRVAMRAVSAS
jgi:hypothetical protein